MIVAISCVSTFVGGYSPWIFQYAWALFLAFVTSSRKSGPIPEYTRPMFGHTTATFSIIESSMRIDEDFFSVAITMPFEAGTISYEIVHFRVGVNYTFNPQTCCPLRNGGEGMFDLDELSTRGEDCEGVTTMNSQYLPRLLITRFTSPVCSTSCTGHVVV